MGSKQSAAQPDGPSLIGRTGLLYYPVALFARLPFAMTAVGVLTLLVAARGSVEVAGAGSAIAGIGSACCGPLIGAAADRWGQRPVLLVAGAANSVMLGLIAWLAYTGVPDWWLFGVAFLVGASVPQISPMSRSRLVMIVGRDLPLPRRPRTLSTVLAYE